MHHHRTGRIGRQGRCSRTGRPRGLVLSRPPERIRCGDSSDVRRLANGQLAGIRAVQLRFDEAEVAAFFGRAGIGGLSAAELATLTSEHLADPFLRRLPQ